MTMKKCENGCCTIEEPKLGEFGARTCKNNEGKTAPSKRDILVALEQGRCVCGHRFDTSA